MLLVCRSTSTMDSPTACRLGPCVNTTCCIAPVAQLQQAVPLHRMLSTAPNPTHVVTCAQRPMSNVIRAGLATGWWALMMTSFSSNMNSDLVKAYNIVLKARGGAGGVQRGAAEVHAMRMLNICQEQPMSAGAPEGGNA